ncbi:MAG: hypothetical protein HC846_10320 [Blastocatellia bacterium]|nr:hypothetical protein [Blastocatellia bacterium]
MKSIFYGLVLITYIFANAFRQTDKKTDEIFKITAPIREMETDLELNPVYQNDQVKLDAAAIRLITEAENAIPMLEKIKRDNPNLSKSNSDLIAVNIDNLRQRIYLSSNADLFTRTAEINLQNGKGFEAVQFAKRAIKLENEENAKKSPAEKSNAAVKIFEKIKAKYDHNQVAFQFWNFDWKDEFIIGYVVRNNYGKWDDVPYIAILGRRLYEGNDGSDRNKRAISEQFKTPVALVVNRNNPKFPYEICEVIFVELTTINLTVGTSPFRYNLTNTPKLTPEYENLKINPEQVLIVPPMDFFPKMQVYDILDAKGLSLVTTKKFPDARGTKLMSGVLDNELIRKNFAEAKAAYQYFDRITAATPNLDIIKSTRRQMLAKMYRIAPDLREFVEAEMTRVNYSDADKKIVRGK